MTKGTNQSTEMSNSKSTRRAVLRGAGAAGLLALGAGNAGAQPESEDPEDEVIVVDPLVFVIELDPQIHRVMKGYDVDNIRPNFYDNDWDVTWWGTTSVVENRADENRIHAVGLTPEEADFLRGLTGLKGGTWYNIDLTTGTYTTEYMPGLGLDNVTSAMLEKTGFDDYTKTLDEYTEWTYWLDFDPETGEIITYGQPVTYITIQRVIYQVFATVYGGPDPEGTILFEDQLSDGTSVHIQRTSLPDGGFITVTDTEGNVLGQSEELEPDTIYEHLEISLDSPITSSQILCATVYIQPGEPYTRNGEPLSDCAFITIPEEPSEPQASLTFEGQLSDGRSVIMQRAALSDGGFIEITDTEGNVLGQSEELESGIVYEHFGISLDQPITSSQTLCATAHIQPGEPYIFNGEPVTDCAFITIPEDKKKKKRKKQKKRGKNRKKRGKKRRKKDTQKPDCEE